MAKLDVYATGGSDTWTPNVRTNIDINDDLMSEAMRLTGITTKKDTVEEALRRLIRLERQKGILDLQGKIQWEGDLDEMRASRFPEWDEGR